MVLDQIPFEWDEEGLFRQLHLDPAGGYAADILAVAREAASLARPKAIYREASLDHRGEDTVIIEGVTFTSGVLRANLAEAERVFAHVATCGIEMDRVAVREDDLIGKFALDAVKEMALHAALEHLAAHLRQRYGLEKMAAMNPGSGDQDVWPIEQQRELFSLLGEVQGQIGVRLTDTFLMLPNKSVSGLFYATEEDFVTCQLCHMKNCPKRRAPFDPHLWQARMV